MTGRSRKPTPFTSWLLVAGLNLVASFLLQSITTAMHGVLPKTDSTCNKLPWLLHFIATPPTCITNRCQSETAVIRRGRLAASFSPNSSEIASYFLKCLLLHLCHIKDGSRVCIIIPSTSTLNVCLSFIPSLFLQFSPTLSIFAINLTLSLPLSQTLSPSLILIHFPVTIIPTPDLHPSPFLKQQPPVHDAQNQVVPLQRQGAHQATNEPQSQPIHARR